MKSSRVPLFTLLILLVGFLALVYFTGKKLPPSIASHFSINGTANDWVSRRGYLIFISVTGIALPLFEAAIFSSIRYFPKSIINVSNRDYWLSSEHIEETYSIMKRYGLWLGSLCIFFVAALHGAVIYANSLNPPRLPPELIGGIGFVFVFVVILWIMSLRNQFRVKEEESQGT